MIVSFDFETRSLVDLKKQGLMVYAEHASTEVLCASYAIDDEAPALWLPTGSRPVGLFGALERGAKLRGWNVGFEIAIWNNVCRRRYGWPELRLEQCLDTMAYAAALNLPQGLGACAEAIGLPMDQQKDKRGKYLIQRLCKPHKPTKARPGVWVDDPALLNEMYEYNKQDVVVERAVAQKIKPLSEFEQNVWHVTQVINQRGIPVALDEVENIIAIVETEKAQLNEELEDITGIPGATKRDQILRWLNANGLDIPDLTADTVDAELQKDHPKRVKRVLEIRSKVCQTSTAKFEKIREIAASDGTIKGMLAYHGASTGRYASRGGFNAQNLPRPSIKDVDTALDILTVAGHSTARFAYSDELMDAAVACVRGVLKAPPGYEFLDADFSSIENRVGVWLAGQQDKVDMFAQGFDEYKVFASTALYNIPYDQVTKDMRQMSKSAVLGCLFGQGATGLIEYAKGYGVELTKERSDEIVKKYRAEYDKVADMWQQCGKIAIKAVLSPGIEFRLGDKIKFRSSGQFLQMQLPSKRVLSWSLPKVEDVKTPWGVTRPGITYMGVDTYTRKWCRTKLIGSSIFQSAVQAIARDLLVSGVLNVEALGYPVVLLVHDEILTNIPEGYGSDEEFMVAMCRQPDWCRDLPIAAEAWRGKRFQK